jgi:hypothetical protein
MSKHKDPQVLYVATSGGYRTQWCGEEQVEMPVVTEDEEKRYVRLLRTRPENVRRIRRHGNIWYAVYVFEDGDLAIRADDGTDDGPLTFVPAKHYEWR